MYAMYPSLDINTVTAVVAKKFLNSDFDLFLDMEMLGLSLALTKDSRELTGLDITDVNHARFHTHGQKHVVTNEEVINRMKNIYQSLSSLPNTYQRRRYSVWP